MIHYKSLSNQGVLHLIEKFIVIDDGSSQEDISKMKRAFPDFAFLIKSENSKGHAKSLNMILDGQIDLLTSFESRYVFP